MKALALLWALLRLFALVAVTWFLVAVASPTPDPLVVVAAWLALAGVALAVAPSRRAVLHWVHFGR